MPALDDYILNIVFMSGDYPAQYFGCKAVTLWRKYGDSSNIPEKILHLVPLLGLLPYRKFFPENVWKRYGKYTLLRKCTGKTYKRYGMNPELRIFPDHEKSIKFIKDTEKMYSL